VTEPLNLYDLPLEGHPTYPEGYRFRSASFGSTIGAAGLGGSVYELDPGESIGPYHYEGVEEEWVLVLTGTPTLRDPEGEHELVEGDIVCFPQGEEGGHKLTNRSDALVHLIGSHKEPLRRKADQSLRRRQLIFSRWVLVMTAFESELYRDPAQDLNALWWRCVKKYQKIHPPQNRAGHWDWATKYHIGLAPVYYFSYLLGEMFASSIQEALVKTYGSTALTTPQAGQFLQAKLFRPGNRMNWFDLITHVTGQPLSPAAWLKEFA
jgi:quercetin dioxygenase-like cupin family protein